MGFNSTFKGLNLSDIISKFRIAAMFVTTGRKTMRHSQWRTQEFFFRGGVQQIQLRTEDRENGDLGAVAPYSGVLEEAVI